MYPFKECREKAGYTQKFVALSLHVKPPSVSDWENGNTCPTLENLEKMADLYQVSIDELLGRTKAAGTGQSAITAQEKKLLEIFQQLTVDGKDQLIKIAKVVLQSPGLREDASISSMG